MEPGASLTPDDVVEAVRAAGLLMEQEVASELEALGFHVRTGRAFTDPDEGKSREIDVWAIWRMLYKEEHKLSVFAEIIAECKSNTDPLVFMARPKNEADRERVPEEFRFPLSRYRVQLDERTHREVPAYLHLNLHLAHWSHDETQKAVYVTSLRKRDGKWRSDSKGLFDSLVYPLAKALRARQQETRPQRSYRPGDWRSAWLFFPVVVTAAPLFVVDTNQTTPQARHVDHVTLIRDLKSKTVEGEFAIEFVARSALQGFITNNVLSFANAVVGRFASGIDGKEGA